jgi:hypothetical protein
MQWMRLLHENAFWKNAAVGVIAVSNRGYNPEDCWRYSFGVRKVICESLAYMRGCFSFHPKRLARSNRVAFRRRVVKQ